MHISETIILSNVAINILAATDVVFDVLSQIYVKPRCIQI